MIVPTIVSLATDATRLAPRNPACWSALGCAQYRAGHWQAAREALARATELRKSDRGVDLFFLAMAHWQLGDRDKANRTYDQACAWTDKNAPNNKELRAIQGEARALLGRAGPTPVVRM